MDNTTESTSPTLPNVQTNSQEGSHSSMPLSIPINLPQNPTTGQTQEGTENEHDEDQYTENENDEDQYSSRQSPDNHESSTEDMETDIDEYADDNEINYPPVDIMTTISPNIFFSLLNNTITPQQLLLNGMSTAQPPPEHTSPAGLVATHISTHISTAISSTTTNTNTAWPTSVNCYYFTTNGALGCIFDPFC